MIGFEHKFLLSVQVWQPPRKVVVGDALPSSGNPGRFQPAPGFCRSRGGRGCVRLAPLGCGECCASACSQGVAGLGPISTSLTGYLLGSSLIGRTGCSSTVSLLLPSGRSCLMWPANGSSGSCPLYWRRFPAPSTAALLQPPSNTGSRQPQHLALLLQGCCHNLLETKDLSRAQEAP